MKIVKIKVYNYSELSEQAQQKAFEERSPFYGWSHENEKSLACFEDRFPVNKLSWNYGGGNTHITFEFTEKDDIEDLSGWRLATYLWNNHKDHIYKGKYYSTDFKKVPVDGKHPAGLSYKFRYSKIILEETCLFTGVSSDDYLLQPIWDFMKSPDENVDFHDLMDDCLHKWLNSCDEDFRYFQSEKAFEEECEANDYEFTEDGSRYN